MTRATVAAQSLYGGAGLGPTVALNAPPGSYRVYRQVYGVLGIESARSVGVRLGPQCNGPRGSAA